MRVKVMNRIHPMSRQEYKHLLTVASEQVPFGIYAVEKGDYAEIRLDRCQSMTQLKEHMRNLKQKGFKVFANGR